MPKLKPKPKVPKPARQSQMDALREALRLVIASRRHIRTSEELDRFTHVETGIRSLLAPPTTQTERSKGAKLTLHFESKARRDAFRGWLSDGGGESDFVSCLQDHGVRVNLDIDYDSDDRVFFHELGGDGV